MLERCEARQQLPLRSSHLILAQEFSDILQYYIMQPYFHSPVFFKDPQICWSPYPNFSSPLTTMASQQALVDSVSDL